MVRWKRRNFLSRLSQSALALLLAGRAGQLAVAQETKPTSVLVLGAGLSGLYTAWLLEAAGVSVSCGGDFGSQIRVKLCNNDLTNHL